MVALVFGVQLGLIFWLGEHVADSPAPGRRRRSPFTWPASAPPNCWRCSDPTLFALPHPQGIFRAGLAAKPRTGSPAPSSGPSRPTMLVAGA